MESGDSTTTDRMSYSPETLVMISQPPYSKGGPIYLIREAEILSGDIKSFYMVGVIVTVTGIPYVIPSTFRINVDGYGAVHIDTGDRYYLYAKSSDEMLIEEEPEFVISFYRTIVDEVRVGDYIIKEKMGSRVLKVQVTDSFISLLTRWQNVMLKGTPVTVARLEKAGG